MSMRLGIRQREMLDKIVKTNGGGVYVDFSNEKLIRSLEKHEMVQGKLNQDGWAVHTCKGLLHSKGDSTKGKENI